MKLEFITNKRDNTEEVYQTFLSYMQGELTANQLIAALIQAGMIHTSEHLRLADEHREIDGSKVTILLQQDKVLARCRRDRNGHWSIVR